MAEEPCWVDLYRLLARGETAPTSLVEKCRHTHNGIGETMLHWYALEGTADVLQQLVNLGFDIEECDEDLEPPIVGAALVGRWDNVRVLRRAGARTRGVTLCGYSYRGAISKAGDAVPGDLRADAYRLDELLDPDGPEDVAVLFLRITRAGVADDAPGHQLTWDEWQLYLETHPEVDTEWWFRFEHEGEKGRPPYIEVAMPGPEQRRQAHAIAVHFGARVDWQFAVRS